MIDNNKLDVAITASVDKLQSLFGTAPDPSTVPTSPTVQRLHDLDL